MASCDSQFDKPQHGHPKRAELLDVNINTGAQSSNTERASLIPGLDSLRCIWHQMEVPENKSHAQSLVFLKEGHNFEITYFL